jgi:predicted PurR-regulated permease PerM
MAEDSQPKTPPQPLPGDAAAGQMDTTDLPEVDEPHAKAEPTPIYVSQRTRTIVLLAIALLFAILVRSVPGIVSTVLLGATLALILSFPVRLLQRRFSRRLSILIVTLTLLGGTIFTMVLVIPLLIAEITQFVTALPSIVDTVIKYLREFLTELNTRGWVQQQPDEVLEDVRSGLLDSAQSLLGAGLNNLVATLSASVTVFITIFGMVFVAVYLLADIPKFYESFLRLWAPKYRTDAMVLWDTMGFSLSRFLSAQVVSLSIQGVLAFTGLYFLGVPYALVLGLVQAITAILPYIGAWIAFIPAFLVALTVSWQTAVSVAILYLAINQIEGNLITPRLQGNAVKVHPILIFVGVIGGGQLFGIMGAILAVPTIAIVRVAAEFFWLRLQVAEDQTTVLAIMRNDTATERMLARSGAAEVDQNLTEHTLEPEVTKSNQ